MVEDYRKAKPKLKIKIPQVKGALVLALRKLDPFEDYKDLLKQVLASDKKSPIILLEMQEGDNDQVKELLGMRKYTEIKAADYKPEELILILENCAETIISMRLHALILAHIAGLKLQAISYDPKLEQLQLQIHRFELDELSKRAKESLLSS